MVKFMGPVIVCLGILLGVSSCYPILGYGNDEVVDAGLNEAVDPYSDSLMFLNEVLDTDVFVFDLQHAGVSVNSDVSADDWVLFKGSYCSLNGVSNAGDLTISFVSGVDASVFLTSSVVSCSGDSFEKTYDLLQSVKSGLVDNGSVVFYPENGSLELYSDSPFLLDVSDGLISEVYFTNPDGVKFEYYYDSRLPLSNAGNIYLNSDVLSSDIVADIGVDDYSSLVDFVNGLVVQNFEGTGKLSRVFLDDSSRNWCPIFEEKFDVIECERDFTSTKVLIG